MTFVLFGPTGVRVEDPHINLNILRNASYLIGEVSLEIHALGKIDSSRFVESLSGIIQDAHISAEQDRNWLREDLKMRGVLPDL